MAAPVTRTSVFRTSDWGGSESPQWNWDYAEVDDDDDDDDDDDAGASNPNRLSVGVEHPLLHPGGGGRRSARCSSPGNPEWDYHEIAPEDNSWDCRNLPRMQIRCYARMIAEEGTVGNFIIRCKQDNSGYALTLKSNLKGDFLTYLVEPLQDGSFGIRGCGDDEAFSTIDELVHFYSAERRESIGIQLKVPVELWPSSGFFKSVGVAVAAPQQPSAGQGGHFPPQKRPSVSLSSPNGDSKRRRSARNPADLCEALFGQPSTEEEGDPRDIGVGYIAVGASYGMPAVKVVAHTFETEPTLDELSRTAILADNKILALRLDGNNPAPKLEWEWPGADDVDAAELPKPNRANSIDRARASLRRGVPQSNVQYACGVGDWPGKVIPFPNASVCSEYSTSSV